MARKRVNTTKLEIVQVAAKLFMKRGYSATSIKAIADNLGISTGHLTFYFPTKEMLLAKLVDMLCDFRWTQMKEYADGGQSLLMGVCRELTSMASICEENEIAKDFYLSAYTHPTTLEIIRKNNTLRSKRVFGEFCPDWSEEHFAQAETLVSGMEYATLMTTGDSAALDVRIAGALNNIMMLYQVPQEIRKQKIDAVLAMDYANIGQDVLQKFIDYIEQTNEQAFEDLLGK